MKNMKIGKNKPRHYTPFCSLWCHDQKQREKAIKILEKVKKQIQDENRPKTHS
jgi:hypothetical protein